MKITEYMRDHLLYLDGGMGTLLQERGLEAGQLPETWNLTQPQWIEEIHRAYYDAGSNVVNTNTFGANSLKFSAERLEQILKRAVELAQRAKRDSVGAQPKWVALDVGPTGKMLKPYGDLDFEDAVGIFSETIRLGVKYGVDLIMIETMSDSYETKAALLAAKDSCDLPVFVSNAYGADGKLLTGASPDAMVAMLEGMGADAIGVNCSLGPKALAGVVEEYLRCASVPILLKPNAGLPRAEEGRTIYDVSSEEFARDVSALVQRGVRIVGGCCGTTPRYLSALVRETAGLRPVATERKNCACISSYTHAVSFGREPVLIGERINPTGKKRLKEALVNRDMDFILKEGITQQEAGAQVLDVNVGLPEVDEASLLTRSVKELQAVVDLPLQIDTADPMAMERALRLYNGKAMINSVNGKQEVMDAVFPLVKKYGGLVVALTLDEQGIPESAEGRLEIARRILAEARTYGLSEKDLIFDPLAMTVSADPRAARETLRALELIREELGCYTSLGVSNVSFGLPARDLVNGTFFAMALERGLSAAIMNPHSEEMMKTYYAYRALSGLDENFADYLSYASRMPERKTAAVTRAVTEEKEEGTALQGAIVKGLRERAAQLTEEGIRTKDPLALVSEEIIPALNRVGEGFEKKTVYLPQLLMSAEAAKAAFEVVRVHATAKTESKGRTVVIATVKGDVHDIGKNIVKLILENYGFYVVDLGKDVSPEEIVEETIRLQAPLVGLSALMTTTVPAMEETIRQLREKAPWCQVMVGGAVLNEEYAVAIGADCYAKDAMEAVRWAEKLLKKGKSFEKPIDKA